MHQQSENLWLRWICQALYYLLNGIAMVVPQWGLAVMVLSVLVGVLMRPLSKIADRLQDQVHEIDARLVILPSFSCNTPLIFL